MANGTLLMIIIRRILSMHATDKISLSQSRSSLIYQFFNGCYIPTQNSWQIIIKELCFIFIATYYDFHKVQHETSQSKLPLSPQFLSLYDTGLSLPLFFSISTMTILVTARRPLSACGRTVQEKKNLSRHNTCQLCT